MRRSVLSAVLILAVCAAVLAVPGPTLADTYSFEGLGGGGAPLSLASNGTSLFVGTQDGTVLRNTEGTDWIQAGRLGGAVTALVYDGASIYAGTTNGEVFNYMYDGTWGWAGYAAGWGNSVTCLLATGAVGSMYAGSSNGHVYRKSGVTSWQDTATYMGSPVHSLTSSSSYVYASTSNGIVFRFNNNPSNPAWDNLGHCGTTDAHIVYNDSLGLYALGYNCHAWMYNGTGWVDTGTVGLFPVTTLRSVGSGFFAGNNRGQVWTYDGTWSNTGPAFSGSTATAALATGGGTVYAAFSNGHVGAYVGGSWTDIRPSGDAPVNALLGSGGAGWAGCGSGQVYTFTDAWTPVGNNIGSSVLSLGRIDANLYAGCSNGTVYRNDSDTWTSTSGPGSPANALAFDGTVLYAGCANGHIMVYQEGFNWLDAADTQSGAVNALAWTGASLFAATQNGEVFRYVGMGVEPTGLNTWGAATLSLCWNGSALYAGTGSGSIYRFDGSTWTDVRPTGWGAVTALASVDGTVFAGTDNGMIYRYIGGTTWAMSGQTGTGAIKGLASWADAELWTGSGQGSWRGALTVPPSVQTGPATSITTSSVTLNGNVTATGGENADERGFRVREVGSPTWITRTETGSFDTGAFHHAEYSLKPDTAYEFQACAHNWTGWTYGQAETFKTVALPKPAVKSVSPDSGPPGTSVTVKGSNFGATQGSSTVTVGGVEAQVSSWRHHDCHGHPGRDRRRSGRSDH